MRLALALPALMVILMGSSLSSAWATFPGQNGVLAFSAYSLNEESTDIDYNGTFVGIAQVPRGPRRLITDGSGPAFSPDGRWLAYHDDGYLSQGIWLTRPDCRWPPDRSTPPRCGRLRRLTRGEDYSPAWTPGGKRIAFVRLDTSIYTVRAKGGGLRKLVRGSAPDWSSRGALAFVGPRGTILVRQPGGHPVNLRVRGSVPSWAPSGARLAFLGEPEGEERGSTLRTINADGSGLRTLWRAQDPNAQLAGPLAPTWSPDGRWIAFIKEYEPAYTGAIYAIRPSGGAVRVLTPALSECKICIENPYFLDLAWRPRRP